jgi:hypothetical protein
MRVIACALLFLAASAHAEPAEPHLEAGLRRYFAERYADALVEFESAYEASPDPRTLLKIAETHRALGHDGLADAAYREYLRVAPDSKLASDVQRRRGPAEVGVYAPDLMTAIYPSGRAEPIAGRRAKWAALGLSSVATLSGALALSFSLRNQAEPTAAMLGTYGISSVGALTSWIVGLVQGRRL